MTTAIRPLSKPVARLRAYQWTPFSAFSAIVATLVAVLSLYPLLRVVARLFWDGGPTIEPLRETLREPELVRLLLTTVIVVAVSGTIALAIGAMLAWLNERTDARMGVFTDTLPLINFLLPAIAGAIGWVLLLSPRAGYLNWVIRGFLRWFGVDMKEGPFEAFSWYALILGYVANLVPFAFLLVSAGLRNVDSSLEEQSRVAGASVWQTLWRVTLPAVRPAIGGAALIIIWLGMGMISVPVILGAPAGIDVLSVRIVELLAFSYPARVGPAIGLSSFVIFTLGIAYYLQRRAIRLQRFGTIGGKGQHVARVKLGKWRPLARLFMIGYLVLAVVLPVLALTLVSLNGFWTTNIDWGNLSFDAFRRTLTKDDITIRALKNSFTLALYAATIAMVIAALLALWVQRARTSYARYTDGAIKFPAAVSNTVMAVGFLLTFGGAPFQLGGTLLLLVLAYIILAMPESTVVADAALSQVGRDLSEASLISGASAGTTFRKVYVPLAVPGLLAGWSLLFVRVASDVNASAILASTGNVVIGFRILEVYQNGSYALLAAVSMVLTVASSCVIVAMLLLSRRLTRWSTGRAKVINPTPTPTVPTSS